jgi:hypothetical protein
MGCVKTGAHVVNSVQHFIETGEVAGSFECGTDDTGGESVQCRFASAWMHEKELGWIWDITLGGRVGIL